MKKEKLKIELGVPEHGWLPINLAFGSFDLQFESSDVPANPIDQLVISLRSVIKGIKTEVRWHLEPKGYYFEFEKISNEYYLNISFTNSDDSERKKIFQINGNSESLILPIYRAIKKFTDHPHDSQNWPLTDKVEIEKLTELIKGLKATQNNT